MHIISSYLCFIILYCSALSWHGRLREPGLPISHIKYTTPATTQHNAARYNTAQPNRVRRNAIHDATQCNTVQHNIPHRLRRLPAVDEIQSEYFPPSPPRDSDGVTTLSPGAHASSPSHRPSRPSLAPAEAGAAGGPRASAASRERSAPLRPSSWPAS